VTEAINKPIENIYYPQFEGPEFEKFPDGITRRVRYKNGLPFSSGLDKNLLALEKRIELKKASLLLVDGGVGDGKTTLTTHCGDFFEGEAIDFKIQYAMGGEQFQEKLQMCIDSKKKVIIYDEAGDFNKRGSLTSFNQRLNRVFETYRGFKILVILALPNFGVLDQRLFDNRIPRLLLHAYNRGDKYGNYKAYSLFRMFYLRHKMQKLIVPPHAYGQVEPNFYGHFLDLRPKRSKLLEQISTEGKREVLNDNVLKNRGLFHTGQISVKLHKSRCWVTQKFKELNIKAEYVYKKKHYYPGEIIDILNEEVKKVRT
jgi:hypothetical protein